MKHQHYYAIFFATYFVNIIYKSKKLPDMKIYFDGASTKELDEILKLGIISGVTTNLVIL